MTRTLAASICFVAVIVNGMVLAQAPPCGVAVIVAQGSKAEERFLPASPRHVKWVALQALPALGARVSKDDGMHLEAKSDPDLRFTLNEKARAAHMVGMAGVGAVGTFQIDIASATESGVDGSRVAVKFEKNKFWGRRGKAEFATPLLDEMACLAQLLSPADLVGLSAAPPPDPTASKIITLAAGTAIRVALREFLFSKTVHKDQVIAFEVVEDVAIDGVVVIRKGASGTGHFTSVQGSRGYGRHGTLEFSIESVTAVDGQRIQVSQSEQRVRGAKKDAVVATAMMTPAFGWLIKGAHAAIRAGTMYDVESANEQTVTVNGWP